MSKPYPNPIENSIPVRAGMKLCGISMYLLTQSSYDPGVWSCADDAIYESDEMSDETRTQLADLRVRIRESVLAMESWGFAYGERYLGVVWTAKKKWYCEVFVGSFVDSDEDNSKKGKPASAGVMASMDVDVLRYEVEEKFDGAW